MIVKYIERIKSRIANHAITVQVVKLLKRYNPPGFKGNSLYAVGKFFLDSLRQENIHLRASSLAYSFFLSLFPFLLFLLTLIAYIPIDQLKEEFLVSLNLVLPESSFSALKGTVNDILRNQRGGLLSLGLIAAIYFSSNGIMTIISALNRNVPKIERRALIQKRLLAIGLTLGMMIILIIIVGLLVLTASVEGHLLSIEWLPGWLCAICFFLINTLILTIGLLVIISGFYYLAPVKRAHVSQFTFISPGSLLTTFLIICTTLILQYYINNIYAYNTVYGSIGAIIALLVLLYFNANCILIGYELNRSINKAIDSRLESRPYIIKKIEG